VCTSGTNDAMSKALEALDPSRVQVFDKNAVTEMLQAVKCPGVLLVFSFDGLGKASGRVVKKWEPLVKEVEAWGGTVLLRMPSECEEWNHHTFAQWTAKFNLLEVKRADDGTRFVTNNSHVRKALHGNKPSCPSRQALRVWLAQIEQAEQVHKAFQYCFGQGSPAVPAVAGTVRTVAAPAMPVDCDSPPEHRWRIPECDPLFPSAVARKVKRAEVEQMPAAKAAVDKEWFKLLAMPHPDGKGKGTWDMSTVREARDIRAEARKTNVTTHFGMIAELCFQKGSELEDDDPLKVYKGRHVFLGDQVKDQDFDYAIFRDLGSAPPTMEAGRAVDALSCVPGYEQKQSDGESAYTQSFLGGGRGMGVPTWVSIPRHRWPPEWVGKYDNPMVLLVLALYGHPDAGGYWEEHCEKAVLECGWVKIEGWQSVFWHEKCSALLVIYVDDFKMASKVGDTVELWAALQKRIRLDPPSDPDRFLGCYLEQFEAPREKVKFILQNHPSLQPRGQDAPTPLDLKDPSSPVRGYKYNMQKYLESAVEKYCAVGNLERNQLKKVATPFVDESLEAQGCVESTGSGKPEAGQLQKVAASVLMTDMFAARLARNDLLRPVGHLATHIHDWTEECDRRLHRLMCYINSSLEDRQIGFVGDPLDDLYLAIFADADFAGDRKDSKSTGGALLVLMGPNTFYPLGAISKKHGCTSHSTVEAEVVSLNTAIRTLGLPALDLWEKILGRPVTLVAYEDNQATAKIVRSGKYAAMRHVKRTHGVQLSFLTEQLRAGSYELEDCHTSVMAADIFTKFFICARKWHRAIQLIGVCKSHEITGLAKVVKGPPRPSSLDVAGAGACSGRPDASSTGKPAVAGVFRNGSLCSFCGMANSIQVRHGSNSCSMCDEPPSSKPPRVLPACPARASLVPHSQSKQRAPVDGSHGSSDAMEAKSVVVKAETAELPVPLSQPKQFAPGDRSHGSSNTTKSVVVKSEAAELPLNVDGDVKTCLRCRTTQVHRLKFACDQCLPKGFTRSLQFAASDAVVDVESASSSGKPVAGARAAEPDLLHSPTAPSASDSSLKKKCDLRPSAQCPAGKLSALTSDELPAMVVHGTYFKHLCDIVSEGLESHVLCVPLPFSAGGKFSGMPDDVEIEVFIDIDKLKTEITFGYVTAYRSLGGSILFKEPVPFDLVKRVTTVKDGLTLYRALPGQGSRQCCAKCDAIHPPGAQFCFDPKCLEPFTEEAAYDRVRSLKGSAEGEQYKRKYFGESTAPGDRKRARGSKGDRRRLSAQDVKKKEKRAKATGYKGHTDKYDQNAEYRLVCQHYEVPRVLSLD
jgi:hypothetical protein